MNRRFLLFMAFATLLIPLARAQSGYRQLHEYKPGGDGGWDYLTMDAASRRLYISRGNHFQVLNIDSGKLEGDITGLQGVHGIALDKTNNKGFISDGRDNSVVVIDLKSLKQTGKVQAGANPDAILFDPFTKRVFAFNGRSNNATAIEAKDNSVAGTVALDGKPEFAVSDGKGRVFVNIEDKSEIEQIDPKSLKVVNQWPLAPCESPSGLAMDESDGRLFAGCDNETMAIVDANSGKLVATEKVGKGVDAAAYDKDLHQAYTSNGQDGTITIVKENGPNDFAVAGNVPTKRSARTMTVDDKTHNLITVAAEMEKAPEQGAGQPRQRPKMVPGSFVVLVYGK